MSGAVDPALVHGWLAARSVARGLSMPVEDSGGWRVDTHGETEWQRYVFARPTAGMSRLAGTIAAPGIFLKLCADADALQALLPPRWAITDANCMMVCDAAPPPPAPLPPGYDAHTHRTGAVTAVRINGPDGDLAASGYAAEHGGCFVYDRIVTADAHRRRGLGRALMTRLGAAREEPSARQVLTATAMGMALYLALGWRVYCPYTTAAIPAG